MNPSTEQISKVFILEGFVSYWNVDRDNLLSLRSLFAFLQEAAIRHADQCGAGAQAKASRSESWVLHKMALAVHRYPRYEETLRVATWSSGIRRFKGYREFRVFCGNELVAAGSSVWLYLNLVAKAICRVPREVADCFPSHSDGVSWPDLEKMNLEAPSGKPLPRKISVRYSDFDANGHVNNTAYLDYLQTALATGGFPPRPQMIQIQFLKEITPATETVDVCLEPRGLAVVFTLGSPAGLFAQGLA